MMNSRNEVAPVVSIGLPLRNGSATLKRALGSLLAQEFEDFEIVVSDNASTDDSLAIVEGFASRDPRIQVFKHAENIGPIPNFKTVLQRARGRYFLFAAHDDEYEPTYVGSLLAELERNPRSAVAGGAVRVIDEDRPGESEVVAIPAQVAVCPRMRRALGHVTGRDRFLFLHFGLFRTPFAKEVFLPVPLVAGSDWLFILHVVLGTELTVTDEVVMSRHIQSSRPSVEKYRGDPHTPGDSHFGWISTCVQGTRYLLSSRVLSLPEKLLVPMIMLTFAGWLASIELQRTAHRWITRLIGEQRRRRLAAAVRKVVRQNKQRTS